MVVRCDISEYPVGIGGVLQSIPLDVISDLAFPFQTYTTGGQGGTFSGQAAQSVE